MRSEKTVGVRMEIIRVNQLIRLIVASSRVCYSECAGPHQGVVSRSPNFFGGWWCALHYLLETGQKNTTVTVSDDFSSDRVCASLIFLLCSSSILLASIVNLDACFVVMNLYSRSTSNPLKSGLRSMVAP